ncbi:MAG: 2-dehydro-3-deoxyphosphogluconate aldolase / (4S)-4-hydroxy-2-oxoglutarate aldolase [Alphaproteobacteria bacterium]|jgi:2-dehydro-3-deoxyphosphogluconate aldolase/(4S)-4-hydroxy-2-oxoglutarate aldolase|nr:2-dehydro-3-deoxyphosphogluconate aldolase / (4S)-4-hydroxy-2-oxoglutarate aldolase [Alphaproteobacteria bacterium]
MVAPNPKLLFANTAVVPVLTIERVEDAVPLARALLAGGLNVIEVTLRTEAALDAVQAIAAEVPETVVGIGTVTQASDIALAFSAGAKFLATPGTPPALATALAMALIPVIPSCATVSEAMALSALGFSVLKFFPAESTGGIGFLKAIAAPLPELSFFPSGGIDASTAPAYLALPNVIAVGGSWMVPKDALAARDFGKITALARAAAALRR